MASVFHDREVTPEELRRVLEDPSHPEHLDLLALLLREKRPDEVWKYVTPRQVALQLGALTSKLGRASGFWTWLLESWKRLGYLS